MSTELGGCHTGGTWFISDLQKNKLEMLHYRGSLVMSLPAYVTTGMAGVQVIGE